ncbi:DUF262 domain-containing protein [Microcoleus sp. FACHB-1]|nr:DUF262 domain-containing protein [Microcoleus sp. FACHB-1]
MTKLKNLNSEFPDEEPEIEEGKWVEAEEETTTEPFDPTLIRMDNRPMTIDLLLRQINERALDLAPDFQRRAGIWKDAAKSRLIESILIRIPLPAFYIDATNEDSWLVVDGLQRLTTLKEFVIDKKLKLTLISVAKLRRPFNRRDAISRNRVSRRIGCESVNQLDGRKEFTPALNTTPGNTQHRTGKIRP